MTRLNRRRFLQAGAAAAATAGGAAALGGRDGSTAGAAAPARATGLRSVVPFDGVHQAGILDPPQGAASFLALDAVAPDVGSLVQGLEALSVRARALTRGGPYALQEVDEPPADSGTLGPDIAPDGLTATIAFGASLFDDRYGLADRRPERLTRMPAFPDDALDPAQCHGDVLLQLCAGQRDTITHAVRELLRATRGSLALRWKVDGFTSAGRGPSPHAARRNLLGFRDGTANPDTADRALMDRLVWTPPSAQQPWTAGGTYQVVRVIRMHVEFWDRVGLREQETMIGRRRDSGAPLGGVSERQDPRLDLDPHGERIPRDAHIRLANPRTAATADQRIVRRGFNFDRGFDAAGNLDQGLIFVAFNQDPDRQFTAVQQRLAGEPLVDYVTPVGGGYFFAPAGARGGSSWVGSGAFSA